ncbi:MAG TPA: SET domain-containing protein-lysine N-methyltransferase [Solirubrobacteraceae bacterium]|jgi:hypothetical protein|nr:SET domain-containing protein-lysine N-methyltransferase [Solirubrobacteraceae bacterium]
MAAASRNMEVDSDRTPQDSEPELVPYGLVRRSTGTAKGHGVFATVSFNPGDLVIPGKVGRLVSANDTHPNQVGPNEWVIEDGFGPLVNHSCDPNCGIRLNDLDGYDFIAMRPIAIGEEVTWDYATRNYAITHFPSMCLCGMAACRGLVTGWKGLSEDRKTFYINAGFFATYLLELDTGRRACEEVTKATDLELA